MAQYQIPFSWLVQKEQAGRAQATAQQVGWLCSLPTWFLAAWSGEKCHLSMPAAILLMNPVCPSASPTVHAAVIAINEAVEKGVAEQTLGTLRNPNAVLSAVDDGLAQEYQEELWGAKRRKEGASRLKVLPTLQLASSLLARVQGAPSSVGPSPCLLCRLPQAGISRSPTQPSGG